MIDFSDGKDDLEDYQEYRVDGILLYICNKAAPEEDEIIIDAAKLFKWKKLIVEGLKAV